MKNAILVAGALLLAIPGQVRAQVGVSASGDVCPDGHAPRGTIGVSSFECSNCRMTTSAGERVWNFSSEPIVRTVTPGSPVYGKVHEGDAIVAVDGHLITTGEGGRRLGNMIPGRAVSLVVRTGNREKTIVVIPEAECSRSGTHADAPAVPASPAAPAQPGAPTADAAVSVGVAVGVPRAAVAPRADAAPATGVAVAAGPVPRPTYTLLPSGWFGFGIQCTQCQWSVEEDTGLSAWEFSSPPEISSIQAGSPASEAGLRRGDVLLEIDGEPLVSEKGGQRFGSVEPGQEVRWTYRRGGATRTTTATAGQRPDMPHPPPAPEPDAEPVAYTGVARAYSPRGTNRLRYSGLVGATSVEVRGTGSVVVNIIEPGREIEIVTSDSRTRIRMDDPK
jgi:S1-C subfamily serine protease